MSFAFYLMLSVPTLSTVRAIRCANVVSATANPIVKLKPPNQMTRRASHMFSPPNHDLCFSNLLPAPPPSFLALLYLPEPRSLWAPSVSNYSRGRWWYNVFQPSRGECLSFRLSGWDSDTQWPLPWPRPPCRFPTESPLLRQLFNRTPLTQHALALINIPTQAHIYTHLHTHEPTRKHTYTVNAECRHSFR